MLQREIYNRLHVPHKQYSLGHVHLNIKFKLVIVVKLTHIILLLFVPREDTNFF